MDPLSSFSGHQMTQRYVDHGPSSRTDRQHPLNWSVARKRMTVFAAVFNTILAAINATSIALLNPVGSRYFGVASETFTLGLTVHMIAIGVTPLVLAPLSELFGRNVIFQTSAAL